jgi:multiple sugar transport system ATP-binding protein
LFPHNTLLNLNSQNLSAYFQIVAERLSGQTYLYVKIAGGDTLVVQTDGDNSSQLRDLVPIHISGDLCHLFNLQGEAVSKTRRHHLSVNK